MHIHLHSKAFWQKLLPCFSLFAFLFSLSQTLNSTRTFFFCWFFFFRKRSPTTQPLHCWTASRHESIHKKGIFFFPLPLCCTKFFPILFSVSSPSAAMKVCLIGLIVLGLPGNICQAKLCGPPIGPAQLLSNFEGREIDGMKHRWSSQLDGSENETHYRHL